MARSRNLSVQQFQDLLARIPPAIAGEMGEAVEDAAHSLAESMRMAARRGKTGNLRASVRVERGKKPLSFVVRAGGPLTTREVRKGSGKSYDYALGTEFGNEHAHAQPFFWPSYRLRKKSLVTSIARKVKPAISKVVPLK